MAEKRELPKVDTSRFFGMSQYRQPLSYELDGKHFSLVMDDGNDYEVDFTCEKIKIAKNGEAASEYPYEAMKGDETTFFVNYGERNEIPRKGVTFILDLEQSLVTEVDAYDGWHPKFPHMTKTENIFGAIKKEDGTIPSLRHGYTEEMVGKAIHWDYGNLEVVHVYQSARYYRLTSPPRALERLKTENPERYAALKAREESPEVYEEPCDYIKVKDGLYIFSMNEQNMVRQRTAGSNLLFLMNLNRMYDVGRGFGSSVDGPLENYTYSAYGRWFDASKLMARKATKHIE